MCFLIRYKSSNYFHSHQIYFVFSLVCHIFAYNINKRCMNKSLIKDWEHTVTEKISSNKDTAGFPVPEDYNTTEDEVREYAYDKQRILDRDEERKKHLVIPGIILVMPVIILSYFGDGTAILLLGVGIGVVLALLYYAVMRLIDKLQLKRMYNADVEKYIEAVMEY